MKIVEMQPQNTLKLRPFKPVSQHLLTIYPASYLQGKPSVFYRICQYSIMLISSHTWSSSTEDLSDLGQWIWGNTRMWWNLKKCTWPIETSSDRAVHRDTENNNVKVRYNKTILWWPFQRISKFVMGRWWHDYFED